MTRQKILKLIARLSDDQKTRSVNFQTRNLTHGEIIEARWLAAVLMRPDLFTHCPLKPVHFQHKSHFEIFVAMRQMREKGIRCNDLPELIKWLAPEGYREEHVLEMLDEILHCRGEIRKFDDYTKALQKRADARRAVLDKLPPEGDIVRLDLAGGATPFRGLTTDQMLEMQAPIEWLLPGMFERRQPGVIVGPSKSMKSSIAVDLCGALATGGKFLDKFAAERPFRVGYVSKFEERQALGDLARRWSESSGVEPGNMPNLIWSLAVADAADPRNLDHLEKWIRLHQLEVIVIDQLRLTSTDKQTQAEQLRALVGRCLAAGATPILCCQSRRAIPRGVSNPTDVSAGLDFARQWMLVERRENYSPGSGQHRLRMAFGGCAGQGGEWGVDIEEGKLADPLGRSWQVAVRDIESIEVEAAASEVTTHRQRMEAKLRVTMIRVDESKATKSHIREQCGINGSRFKPLWNDMIELGKIVAVQSHDQTPLFPVYRWIERSSPPEKNLAVRSGGEEECRSAECRMDEEPSLVSG